MADEALEIAKRIKHSLSYSRPYLASGLHAFRREWPVVEAQATAAIASRQRARHGGGSRKDHASVSAGHAETY
jgi:hypothetical protein